MNSFFRPSVKADISIFKEVFQEHDLSTLYAVFRNYTPKYVLDAGPGSGARTQMLKKIFPSSVLVALEPDPARFENLMLNTRE